MKSIVICIIVTYKNYFINPIMLRTIGVHSIFVVKVSKYSIMLVE
jgi:hypothetical protein